VKDVTYTSHNSLIISLKEYGNQTEGLYEYRELCLRPATLQSQRGLSHVFVLKGTYNFFQNVPKAMANIVDGTKCKERVL
jgi:hypothetical protein